MILTQKFAKKVITWAQSRTEHTIWWGEIRTRVL